MSYEQKPGQGSVFKNDRKESDNHPDYKGDATCPCCRSKVWLDMWVKRPEGKKPFMSVSMKAKDAAKPAPAKDAPKSAAAGGRGSPSVGEDFEDLPF